MKSLESMNEQPLVFFPQKKDVTKEIVPAAVPEEIVLQPEVREQLKEMKGSANRWFWMIADAVAEGKRPDTKLLAELLINEKHELPVLVSAVMERTCNLQCAHCFYQDEKSSAQISKDAHLGDRIVDIVSQMPQRSEEEGHEYEPQFLSCGRILRPWHLDVFTKLRSLRPDVELGVVDNGTFTSLLSKWPEGFKFDWMDISVDGIEESHNEQRRSPKAFAQAIEGLKRAREVTKPASEGGRVTSLLTLTNINARDIEAVADTLLASENGNQPLVDQLNVTTVGLTNDVNTRLEASAAEFQEAWEQLKRVSSKYRTGDESRVEPSIYRIQDIEKLAATVGEKRFLEQFTETDGEMSVKTGRCFVILDLDGVKINYQPLSIWTPEEFLIEADGAYRAAYEGQFTLEELRTGKAQDGRDTTPYTFEQLTADTNFRETYERAVDTYWTRFGKAGLEKEIATFERIREKAKQ